MTSDPVLPELLHGAGGLVMRRWVPADARALGQAVTESLEHLRPWMPWTSQEPMSPRDREAMIRQWELEWSGGGDVYLSVHVGGRIAGGCGLHRRIGPHGLEIGYWIHPGFVRRGWATEAARVLTDAALATPGIDHVQIHHDKANQASAGVPAKLGYELVAEVCAEIAAPAEIGVECRWRMTDRAWRVRQDRTVPVADDRFSDQRAL